jgi:hypothetical protein
MKRLLRFFILVAVAFIFYLSNAREVPTKDFSVGQETSGVENAINDGGQKKPG